MKKSKSALIISILSIILISFIYVWHKQSSRVENNINSVESTEKKSLIKVEQLVGSWLDTSESKLHFTLFKDGTARSDNMNTLLYKKWRLDGKYLILTEESIGNGSSSIDDYKYEIISLNDKELVLKNENIIERYIKKK